MSKETLAVRVDDDIRTRLDTLADAFGKTRSSVINDALRQYVEFQEWQVDLIKTRHAALRDGNAQTISHEDVLVKFDQRFCDKSAG